jgi:hypothetical protein
MRGSQVARGTVAALGLLLIASAALAQTQPPQFVPQVGQPAKDGAWIPTSQELVNKMLDVARVTPADFVIDLGSGDGRIVITAARRGARALGIEYEPDMVEVSRANAAREGVSGKAEFVKADFFESDFSKATVITMFLRPDIVLKLRPKILDLTPGTRIVSNSYEMGEWEADETETIEDGCSHHCTALLWIVPAKVDGVWKMPQGALTFSQQFQMVTGTYAAGGNTLPIVGGRLRGDQITFSAGTDQYRGRVNGAAIKGSVTSGGKEGAWRATRTR